MCTIAALRGVHPEFSLIIAANRDEFYARAATPPAVASVRPRRQRGVGQRDVRAGGSWMGVTARASSWA
ncbi:MAG: NRDE family protein [Polyangiales bacterium]